MAFDSHRFRVEEGALVALRKALESFDSTKLTDGQDTSTCGDSHATRTCRITFSTTQEIGNAIENAAYERHMNRSRLIEAAVVAFLGLER